MQKFLIFKCVVDVYKMQTLTCLYANFIYLIFLISLGIFVILPSVSSHSVCKFLVNCMQVSFFLQASACF